ncbi:hypothetical protein AGMMS49992_29510 [Clostridia bacterium]|nr:hypothetical protein AGMMS49992_29510 [Clostridia bacterium]
MQNARGPELVIEMETDDAAKVINAAYNRTVDTIYLLDLDLGDNGRNGLDVAQSIRAHDSRSYIVYISAHQELWQACFSTKASDFLIKPVTYPQFEQCLNGVVNDFHLITQEQMMELTIGSCCYRVSYNSIYYFEKQRDHMLLERDGMPLRWRETFTNLLKILPSNFMLVHQGYVVNISKIDSLYVRDKSLRLTNGKVIPVSRSHYKAIESILKGGAVSV